MTPKGNSTGGKVARRRGATSRHDAWLSRLNEQLSVATRRLFQSQLVLRSASELEIRAQLPELCALATSVCEAASSSKERKAIWSAFRNPQAQWLSRSAVESGASGFFCHLLLRETARPNHSEDAGRLVLQVLLDPVLQNCYERSVDSGDLGSCRACEWRSKKPKYYAMACAGLWETLLPFLVRGARQHAALFEDVLNELMQQQRASVARVNCRLAQVGGFWRLLDALCDPKTRDQSPDVQAIVPSILAFAAQWSVLCESEQDGELANASMVDVHARYHDMLMEKFFVDLQEFLFKSANATNLASEGIMKVFHARLGAGSSQTPVQQVRLSAFLSVACLLVKRLGSDIGGTIKDTSSKSTTVYSDENLPMYLGIVSHIHSVPLPGVLALTLELLNQYDGEASSVEARRRHLLWAMYVIVCRQQDFDATKISNLKSFSCLQQKICLVPLEDLQMMPLHWMEVVWKRCIGIDEDGVQAFVDEARLRRIQTTGVTSDTMNIPIEYEELVQRVPFRKLDQYPSVLAILEDPIIRSLKSVDPSPVQKSEDVAETIARQIAKKRRRLRREVVVLSEEHEESRRNALLLPEVMEKICSYMSAKRLTRLSLVCKAFAGVARQDRLWKPLYAQLVQPLKVKCRHGNKHEHSWRTMYQGKYVAIKRMRNRQLAAARKAQREQDVMFCWHEDDNELRRSVTMPSALLCHECGCNHLSLTHDAAKNHCLLHQRYRCPDEGCRVSLTSAQALKQHERSIHPTKTVEKGQVTDASGYHQGATKRYQCTISDCSRSYQSIKWLENHMTRVHGAIGRGEAMVKLEGPLS